MHKDFTGLRLILHFKILHIKHVGIPFKIRVILNNAI
jgi:hypothetical protein